MYFKFNTLAGIDYIFVKNYIIFNNLQHNLSL